MSDRVKRVFWGVAMAPPAAVLGFLVGGHLASALSNSGSALADSASVALTGVAAAIVAAGAAAWAASRRPLERLPRTAIILLLLATLAMWATIVAADRRSAVKAERSTPGTPSVER